MAKNDRLTRDKMKLSLFASHYHLAGWRHPNAYSNMSSDIQPWIDVAQKLERAKFDMLFVADAASLSYFDTPQAFERSSGGGRFAPIVLCSALAMVTTHLGLVSTMSTSYAQPYDVARELASLDLLSKGRAGWNVVTGSVAADAKQYGDAEAVRRPERYARGEEFVDVALALWGSIEPGAFPQNRETGIFADLKKVHAIAHHGKYYSVSGPLSVSPSPQGRPVLVQAGQSQDGRDFASRIAEVIFTAWSEFDMAKRFYDDIKSRAAARGRDPGSIKILPGVRIIVGRTAAEAREKEEYLNSLLDMELCRRRAVSSIAEGGAGIDLGKYPLDTPFSDLPDEVTKSVKGRAENHLAMALKYNLTLRDIIIRAATNNAHFTVSGTASDIVDQMEYWFEGGAADGFNVMCGYLPDSLDDVIEFVIPELQRRGLFRHEYEGRTLRENLGVPMAAIPPQTDSALQA
ncbi:MAG TPA: LLM class flavin-dependent oxidoreductase [Novosphingobium sp.]|nr:LLM class flavin-dependent oxidoreductase [Novosphingobium sp.]